MILNISVEEMLQCQDFKMNAIRGDHKVHFHDLSSIIIALAHLQ